MRIVGTFLSSPLCSMLCFLLNLPSSVKSELTYPHFFPSPKQSQSAPVPHTRLNITYSVYLLYLFTYYLIYKMLPATSNPTLHHTTIKGYRVYKHISWGLIKSCPENEFLPPLVEKQAAVSPLKVCQFHHLSFDSV